MGNNYSELKILQNLDELREKGFMIYSSDKNKKRGKIIFSLEELPIKEVLYTELGNKLFRFNQHIIEINGLRFYIKFNIQF